MRQTKMRTVRTVLIVIAAASALGFTTRAQTPAIVASGELTLALEKSRRPSSMVPQTVKLLIRLTADSQGIVAMPPNQIAGFSVPAIERVTWQRVGADLVIKWDGMHVGNSTFTLDTFRLRLEGNTVDRGTGVASGHMTLFIGDTVNGGAFEASITLTADRMPPTGALSPTWSAPGEPLLPREPLRLTFSEPVDADAIRASVRLLTGGEVVPSKIDVINAIHGLAGNALLTPMADVAPGARLTVDARGVVDMFGNVVAEVGQPLQTISTPGNALANGGFELGLKEWVASGAVAAVGTERGVVPHSGVSQAALNTSARLVGRITPPATASALTFRVAAFSEGAGFDARRSAVVWIVADGERHAIFDAGLQQAAQTAPANVTADVARWRNRDVLIVAEVRGSGYYGMNYHIMLLDDFSVR